MDWLRKIVSGNRRRFEDPQYNLDITYITNRILAMSFPATGFEKMYRNNINDVANFLKQKHGKHFRIFNMSGRSYDTRKFGEKMVEHFEWEDHHSPALHILFEACMKMHVFLKSNPKNVVVVHCNAGKGRTGTLISCYLIYSGLSDNPLDAITYYGWKRFSHGKGVTQPSQVRYVYYFDMVYKGVIRSPVLKSPERIIIHTIPSINHTNKCKPYVEIVNGTDFQQVNSFDSFIITSFQIWSNKQSMNLKTYKQLEQSQRISAQTSSSQSFEQKMVIQIENALQLSSDLYFRIKHRGQFKCKLICRFALNPAFVTDKSRQYIKEPSLQLEFQDRAIFQGHMQQLQTIRFHSNQNHDKPNHQQGVLTNFNSTESDYDTILKQSAANSFEDIKHTTGMHYDDTDTDQSESDISDNQMVETKFDQEFILDKASSDTEANKPQNTLIQKIDYEFSNSDSSHNESSNESQSEEEQQENLDVIQENRFEEEEEDKADDLQLDRSRSTTFDQYQDDEFFQLSRAYTEKQHQSSSFLNDRKVAFKGVSKAEILKSNPFKNNNTLQMAQKRPSNIDHMLIPRDFKIKKKLRRSKSTDFNEDKSKVQQKILKTKFEKQKIKNAIQQKKRMSIFRMNTFKEDKLNPIFRLSLITSQLKMPQSFQGVDSHLENSLS
ncbi:phosphatidylinositol--trisphosphate 3-phosphatase [Stylonychia lemnae]|uniref:Phosphatidylinositol--trisphosphate 3-phosphatase n=1 Tax=Stylonychia lemnae TaxID=5949 RepID=A0A078AY68_STYLE|nr:phosphatidylinositol--trisphosphate 3-phosphatase [Stylonychia lemnae]|eukprot:CDW87066.1 phosphatidylinositol--trisphosphate 3-phosphatase [Stylonychia lemnae]